MSARLPLSEPQERHVATILAHLERAVRDLRNDAGKPPESVGLTEYEEEIDPALAGALGELIGKVEAGVVVTALGTPSFGLATCAWHVLVGRSCAGLGGGWLTRECRSG